MSEVIPKGRLELTWTNKHLRLIDQLDGSYQWVGPADWRVAEVRLLQGAEDRKDRAEQNLLIQGDALAALRSLTHLPEFAPHHVGKVRLAYLDPPFNTGQAFAQYDDALEHSVWLTMLRDRLQQIRGLLSDDGSVWLHLDDAEMHRARLVMDEVFGPENFVAVVIWEKADSPRNSARQFSTDHDYILVYSKRPDWCPNRLPRTDDANAIYENPDDDPRGAWYPGDPYANKPYSLGRYTLTGPTGREFKPPPGRYWRVSEAKFRQMEDDGRIWWGTNGSARPSIKRYVNEVADLVPRTLWGHKEVGSNRTSKNEMRKLFPGQESFSTPKPEKLMHRILLIATNPGDLVLDCFAGSGSTPAVAHKMQRRWIATEREPSTIDTYIVPRLQQVIQGGDPGAATEISEWSGGGEYLNLIVAPSMFTADEDDHVWLAEWACDDRLAEATAAQMGFSYEPDGPFAGRRGRKRLVVIDGLVQRSVIEAVGELLPEGEALVVAGTAVAPEAAEVARKVAAGSSVRKIPTSILQAWRRTERVS